MPDVAFTATHPLVRRNINGDNAYPELGKSFVVMVAMDDGCSLNPTWQSVPTKVLHGAEMSSATEEVLYDLVLEADFEPLSYFLRSGQTGQVMEALSEALHIAWFPHAVRFLAGMLDGCCSASGGVVQGKSTAQYFDRESALEAFLQALEDDTIHLAILLDTAAIEARQRLLAPIALGTEKAPHMAMPSRITLESLLDAGSSNDGELKSKAETRQLRADVLERCVGKLGRLINDYSYLGWAMTIRTAASSNVVIKKPYFLVHTLTYLSIGNSLSEPTHSRLHIVVKGPVDGNANNAAVVADVTLPVQREGWMTFEVGRGMLPGSSIRKKKEKRRRFMANRNPFKDVSRLISSLHPW